MSVELHAADYVPGTYTMAKPTHDELRTRFLSHKPGPEAAGAHVVVSCRCLSLAMELVEVCPEGRQLSLALTALEEVRMRANAAIAETQPIAEQEK